MTWEHGYLKLVEEIIETGEDRHDRTGVGTRALFGKAIEIDLSAGFPAMTTKQLAWKAMVAELIWFIEGSGDERRLAEIQFGTRDKTKTTIWTANAEADYWKPKAKFDGDLGRVYGVQWRNWRNGDGKQVDQLASLLQALKTDPTSRRLVLSAWNAGELDQMALPPCHMMAQFFVNLDKGELSCQMYQRSVDVALGLPFNIASYALLTHIIATVSGYKVGKLRMCLGDTHLYQNHIEPIKEQLNREPLACPSLRLPETLDLDNLRVSDFELVGYNHHPKIFFPMAT